MQDSMNNASGGQPDLLTDHAHAEVEHSSKSCSQVPHGLSS